MTSSAPLVLKWNDANTISVNKPGAEPSISFINTGSTRKIGAYSTDFGLSLTLFEISHGTQSKLIINRPDFMTRALYFESDIGTNKSNQLICYNATGAKSFLFSSSINDDNSNQFIIDNLDEYNAFSFTTNVGTNKSNELAIYNKEKGKRFEFKTDIGTNNATELYIYNASANKAFEVSTNVGDNASSNQINIYDSAPITAFRFSTDSGDNNTSNEFYIYDSSGFNAFGFRTDKDGNNDTNEFAGYTHNEIEYFKFSAKVGDDTFNRFDIYRAIGSYALSFLTDVGANNANQLYVYNAIGNNAFKFMTNADSNNANQLYVYNANDNDAFRIITDVGTHKSNEFYIYNAYSVQAFVFKTNVNANGASNEFSIYNPNITSESAIKLVTNLTDSLWYNGSVLRIYNCEDPETEAKLAIELGSGADMPDNNYASALRFYNVNKTGSQPDYALEYIARDYNSDSNTTILNHLKINSNAGPYLELATDGGLSSSGSEPGFGIRILEKDKPEIVKLYCNNATSKVRFQLGDGVNAESGFEFNTLDTTLGASSTRNLFVIRRPSSTANAFMFSSTESNSNDFTIYNSETVASTALTTSININNTGIVLPLKFQSSDTTVPTGTNGEGICVFDSESLTATSADATKTAMLKRTVPSTYAVQQALNSRFNIAPFELEVTTDAQGKGVLFRIKLPAAYSTTNQDQYYDFDFSAKNHGYNP